MRNIYIFVHKDALAYFFKSYDQVILIKDFGIVVKTIVNFADDFFK